MATPDSHALYVVGNDKKLKELEEVGGTGTQVTKELDTGTGINSIALPAGTPLYAIVHQFTPAYSVLHQFTPVYYTNLLQSTPIDWDVKKSSGCAGLVAYTPLPSSMALTCFDYHQQGVSSG